MKIEINIIVSDARESADYYKKILNAKIISKTDNEKGMNEITMKLGEVDIRVLDENQEMGLFAPNQVGGQSIGINLFVDDIESFVDVIIKEDCNILSPITEFPEVSAKNAVFSDKFNHVWVVNQKY